MQREMTRAALLGVAALLLTGCASPRPASVYDGECRVFQDPGFRVRGLTTKDRRWIATTQEQGIQVCGWQRPPSMPEPALLTDCATVKQVVGLFGGDVAKAEAYAVAQGATQEHIVAARQCLAQPVAVKAPKKFRGAKRQIFLSKRTLPTTPEVVPIPAPAPTAIPSPISPAHADPVAPVSEPAPTKPTRWQRTTAKAKAGWERVKRPFRRKAE